MAERPDKEERRRMKAAWQANEREQARMALPLPDEDLAELFQFVETRFEREGCDHTRRFTEQWMNERAIEAQPVLLWLDDNGGFCDCEVVANSRQKWEWASGSD